MLRKQRVTLAFAAGVAMLAGTTSGAQANERCGAFAYAAKGAWGHAVNAPTCAEATRIAQAACRAKARTPDETEDCDTGTQTHRGMWFFAMRCEDIVGRFSTFINVNASDRLLESDVRHHALMNNHKPETCTRIIQFHSDGRKQ